MKTVENFSYTTRVKFNLATLKAEVEAFQSDETATKTAKNNALSLYKKLAAKSGTLYCDPERAPGYFVDSMTGTSKGNTARIYYNPSYTQYPKVIRKAIVPLNPENKFVYFDVKAAEYILNCIFAGDEKTLDVYRAGGDPYTVYSDIFPAGTTRPQMKEALIANMYGMSSYTLAKRLACSQDEAERILLAVNLRRPAQAKLNQEILRRAEKAGAYFCPNGVNRDELVQVAEVDPSVGYNPNRALSVYTQSALGLWMQSMIRKMLDYVDPSSETLISVFDSMLFEVDKSVDEDQVRTFVNELAAPFRVEVGFGNNFYSAQTSAR